MYEWFKVAHIISFVAWMVGLLYLPRLMVYHSVAKRGSDLSENFKVMERRLLKAIMTPAMIATWIFGLAMAAMSGFWFEIWFMAKFALVIVLSGFHMVAIGWVRKFAVDENQKSQRFFRMVNEIPTLMMIFIVILVIIKPF